MQNRKFFKNTIFLTFLHLILIKIIASLHFFCYLKNLCFCSQIIIVIKMIIRMIKLMITIKARYNLILRKKIYIKKIKYCYKNKIYVYTYSFFCK